MNSPANIRACVFDAYGTLFDVHSAVARHEKLLGDRASSVSQTWRSKQLEYTWLRSLMGRYTDFYAITADALDYALATHRVADDALREALLNAYLSLDCYPEVPSVLDALRQAGVSLAILSNGTRAMLDAAVTSAGLDDVFDAVLSVHELGVYKPDPRVYRLACERLRVEAGEVMFQSSNAWDAVGAKSFGFNVTWINRFSQQPERLNFAPDNEGGTLDVLLEVLGIPAGA
ncbi:MAG: haloacid dehalogenase type II [Proteobacteria bacterium]|nr:MAG: haloacid dehalogenase type II [Pseudomonadota bacterium]